MDPQEVKADLTFLTHNRCGATLEMFLEWSAPYIAEEVGEALKMAQACRSDVDFAKHARRALKLYKATL